MSIPSFTLSRQIALLGPAIGDRLTEVMASGQFILGPVAAQFETEIATVIGARHAVGVANGSDALYLALLALGIGPGDEVLTTPFTFFATAGSILRTGAKPVFTDIQLDTFNMDPDIALARVTPRIRAMLPVHLFGLMTDMTALARGYAGPIVEDAAQAIGASLYGHAAGTMGSLGCFSFFPTKNLGAFGDAGLVTSEDGALAAKVRILRVHGASKKYFHDTLGINSRIDAVQAAILSVKLPYLAEWTKRRIAVAARYTKGLTQLGVSEIVCPITPEGFVHVFHQYTIRASRRDALAAYLKEQGIGTTVYYPLSLHLQPVFKDLGYKAGDFPHSETAQETVLSLPMFPELLDSEVDQVVQAIAAFYGHRA
ncbi:MAG: DegT/DnrJ/EryC1/StrS family aminotransferase [Sulfobacillus sp.]